ncbi:biliverdin-producing heme oxygenase [Stella sp.]|uniref:biliverdin-producing heme oxygenase n=1 Tax=Stella sp. TaxID=2912054 RepID=UPI0035B2D4F2
MSRTAGLSDRLRAATHDLHRRAERAGHVGRLLAGGATTPDHLVYLCNLLPAYRALEAGLERHRAGGVAGLLALPALYRAPALEADLARLAGRDWAAALPLLPAGRRYAEAVAAAAGGDGAALVGHAYARHLGDLGGGPILERRLARTPGLAGLAFHAFPDIADRDAFRAAYRRALDAAGARMVDPWRAVAAARAAFRWNIAVAEAVGARTARPFARGAGADRDAISGPSEPGDDDGP